MSGAKEIRTKIKSIQSTRKITGAMQMVAASKMRRAQDRMRASRPYAADRAGFIFGDLDPIAAPIGQFTPPATPITFMLPASDPDGDPLTVTFSSVPTGWIVTNTGLQVTVTPAASDTSGVFTFGYEVEDPGGLDDDSTIQVTISSTPVPVRPLPGPA